MKPLILDRTILLDEFEELNLDRGAMFDIFTYEKNGKYQICFHKYHKYKKIAQIKVIISSKISSKGQILHR